jgi:hypothetical protein
MMRNGTAYRLQPLVRLTDATGSGSWPTPHGFSPDVRSNGPSGNELGRAVNQSMWPTPTGRDWKDGSAKACANVPSNGLLGREIHQHTIDTGSLNPLWVEWLMGYPSGWTDLRR